MGWRSANHQCDVPVACRGGFPADRGPTLRKRSGLPTSAENDAANVIAWRDGAVATFR
jgi:hypothetical protein